MKQRNKPLLFVYGTLLTGFPLHHYLKKSSVKFLGQGSVQGQLYDLGEYPGAVPAATSMNIKGEVYELRDPKDLNELDKIEEYNPRNPNKSLFVRRKTNVRLESGENVPVWVYFLPRKPRNGELIQSGDYRRSRVEFQK